MMKRFNNLLIEFCNKNKIDLLVLFGSFSKGKQKKNSDIDFAYYSKIKLNDLKLLDKLYNIFENKFEIDLINLNKEDLNPFLKFRIFKEGKIIFENQKYLFIMLKERAYFSYIDSKRFDYLKDNLLKKAIV